MKGFFKVPEQYRVKEGRLASTHMEGNNGLFIIDHPNKNSNLKFRVIASDGMGWDHVSVSLSAPRCPTWEEMCWIKGMFWTPEACVIQYHPAVEDYVNNHQFCLHLWRPTEAELPKPPNSFVGY